MRRAGTVPGFVCFPYFYSSGFSIILGHADPALSHELPDPGQVVVVMFGNEVEMVDQAHRGFQAWMGKSAAVGQGIEVFDPAQQRLPRRPEVGENAFYRLVIVVCVLGFAIRQVGGGELFPSGDKILYTGEP